mmetsp:Transcript_14040/g.40369  ORF Transcript_14040/g.40369 Transcript_14040/m.40369 type:complete len:161 (+) Transcript_14040:115-597(+)
MRTLLALTILAAASATRPCSFLTRTGAKSSRPEQRLTVKMRPTHRQTSRLYATDDAERLDAVAALAALPCMDVEAQVVRKLTELRDRFESEILEVEKYEPVWSKKVEALRDRNPDDPEVQRVRIIYDIMQIAKQSYVASSVSAHNTQRHRRTHTSSSKRL